MTQRKDPDHPSVVEIDAMDLAEWEQDQHTPVVAEEDVAALLEQTRPVQSAVPTPEPPRRSTPVTVPRTTTGAKPVMPAQIPTRAASPRSGPTHVPPRPTPPAAAPAATPAAKRLPTPTPAAVKVPPVVRLPPPARARPPTPAPVTTPKQVSVPIPVPIPAPAPPSAPVPVAVATPASKAASGPVQAAEVVPDAVPEQMMTYPSAKAPWSAPDMLSPLAPTARPDASSTLAPNGDPSGSGVQPSTRRSQQAIETEPLPSNARRKRMIVLAAAAGTAVLAIVIVLVVAMGGGKSKPQETAVAAKQPTNKTAEIAEPAHSAAAAATAGSSAPEPANGSGSATKDPGSTSAPDSAPKAKPHPHKPVVVDYDVPGKKDAKPAAAPHTEDDAALAKARAAYAAGNRSLFDGDPAGAVRSYQASLAAYPGYAAGYRGLGLAYAQQGNKAKASQAFRTYMAMAPSAKDVALIQKRVATLQH